MAAQLSLINEMQARSRLAANLPEWRLEGGQLARTWRTQNWKATLMAINAIGHFAEAAWHHPEIHASYSSVSVFLHTHDAGGVTERDFELAGMLEQMIGWRPPATGSSLEGVPPGEAHGYIVQSQE